MFSIKFMFININTYIYIKYIWTVRSLSLKFYNLNQLLWHYEQLESLCETWKLTTHWPIYMH